MISIWRKRGCQMRCKRRQSICDAENFHSMLDTVGAIILLLTMEAAALIVLLGARVIAELQRSRHAGAPWYEDMDAEE